MHKNKTDLPLLVLFIAVSTLLYFVFAPFLAVLSLAAVFAVLLDGPYEKLSKFFGGWRSFAALLTVSVTLLFFIVPFFFVGMQILHEAQSLYVSGIQGNGATFVHTLQGTIETPIRQWSPGFTFDLQTYIGNSLIFISENLGALAFGTIAVILNTFFLLLALFFFLRDGRFLLASFAQMSPLGQKLTKDILSKMYQTIGSILRGTFVNALIRWLCIWSAFYVFGIPNALLWSSLGGIIGAIPGLGTPFSFVGAIVYLYLQGAVLPAIGLTIAGIAVVVLVDNVLTSYFFGRGLEVSPIFVLFSILGGVVLFGPIGFILGPLVLSVFLSVIRSSSLSEREVSV